MTDIIENEATEKNENTEVSAEASVSDIGTSEPKREVIFEEALEAILFAAGHPISYATLARVFDYTPGAIKNKVLRYAEKYNDIKVPRGVILLTYADSCQLCTKQYYLNEIRDTLGIKKSGTLSTSAMEVLAIVAYNAGPGNINKWLNNSSVNTESIDEFVENIPFLETKNYIKKILSTYWTYVNIYSIKK